VQVPSAKISFPLVDAELPHKIELFTVGLLELQQKIVPPRQSASLRLRIQLLIVGLL